MSQFRTAPSLLFLTNFIPGDMLGLAQSGIKGGLTVIPETHWHLLNAAAVCGRGFLAHHNGGDKSQIHPREGSSVIEQLLADGNIKPFYNQTRSSSQCGFALRVMMALFSERMMNDESNTLEAINTLQNLEELNGGKLSQDDQSIQAKIIDLFNEREDIRVLPPAPKAPIDVDEPVLPRKPHVSAFNSQVQPLVKRLDLLGDDVIFIVLDVETTGLDDKTCFIIQLAAKVLGSDDEMDLFSGKCIAFNTPISLPCIRSIFISPFSHLFYPRVYPSAYRVPSKENRRDNRNYRSISSPRGIR